ncbi:NAD(P)-dependent oxidoreductase [Azospirillum sp. SYSU D00513]|uniref:NAD(P)-dependent oxidoreductase n=1 Tax=Azospirillum sp. SYSU D00513 TaxID=2812561 RepID=UPI0032B5DF67
MASAGRTTADPAPCWERERSNGRERGMDIGFVGLGGMGRGMAANLVKAGHRVRVWNRSSGPAEEMRAAGAEPVARVEDAMQGEAVLSILADDSAMRDVFLAGGALDRAAKGLIHVNMATVSAAFVRELMAAHAERGLGYVAAPVFGRTDVAAAGKLNILAAGDPAAVERVQPLLDAMGQKTWPLGDDPLRANIVKIAGNFMIAAAIESMGEAVALGRGHGIAAGDLLEIMTNTLFSSPVYKGYGGIITEERYDPAAFKLTLGLKDVRLALAAGDAANVPLPLASLLRDGFLEAVAHGDADKDWAALARVSARRAGLD